MTAWGSLEGTAGDLGVLARNVRARFEATGLAIMATLRADGSPRVTGIETFFGIGELWLGSMPGSRKSADLRRDGRVALHAATSDKAVADGDAKLSGRAVLVEDPAVQVAAGEALAAASDEEHPEPGTYDLFRVDIDELGFLRPEGDHLVIEWWTPAGGYRRVDRS